MLKAESRIRLTESTEARIDRRLHFSREVLLVEDQRRGKDELTDFLKGAGFVVRRAQSGRAAVRKLTRFGPEVILMDIKMPGPWDGIDAAAKMQNAHPLKSIIFVTAFADDKEYRRRCAELKLRIAGWIEKPLIRRRLDGLLDLIDIEIWKVHLRRSIGRSCRQTGISQSEALEIALDYDRRIPQKIKDDLRLESISEPTALRENELNSEGDAIDNLYEEISQLISNDSNWKTNDLITHRIKQLRTLQEREARAMESFFKEQSHVDLDHVENILAIARRRLEE